MSSQGLVYSFIIISGVEWSEENLCVITYVWQMIPVHTYRTCEGEVRMCMTV